MLRRILVLASAAALLSACSDSSLAPSSHSSAQHPLLDLRAALTAQRRHTTALLKIPGVVGTAVTTLSDGRPGVYCCSSAAALPACRTHWTACRFGTS